MTDNANQGPVEIELDELPDIEDNSDTDLNLPEATGTKLARIAARRPSPLLRWTVRLLLALIGLVLGIWAWDFATTLIARSQVLGWVAFALIAGLVLMALLLTLRELIAISRLSRIDRIRSDAQAAKEQANPTAARKCLREIQSLHSQNASSAWGGARFKERADELVDAPDLLALAERELLRPLDAQAAAEVEAAAARVATVTALVPMALADVAVALYSNVTMIRRIAEIYGGRSGTLGAWRLTRAVITHLAATGAVAVGDDLLGSALGGGVLSKLSRRFGEGLINGALTARVGITAMDLCRPLPFDAEPRPKVTSTVRRALAGLVTRDKDD